MQEKNVQTEDWRPATLLKKTPAQVFSYIVFKFFKNKFFTEQLQATSSTLHGIFFFRAFDHLIISVSLEAQAMVGGVPCPLLENTINFFLSVMKQE